MNLHIYSIDKMHLSTFPYYKTYLTPTQIFKFFIKKVSLHLVNEVRQIECLEEKRNRSLAIFTFVTIIHMQIVNNNNKNDNYSQNI